MIRSIRRLLKGTGYMACAVVAVVWVVSHVQPIWFQAGDCQGQLYSGGIRFLYSSDLDGNFVFHRERHSLALDLSRFIPSYSHSITRYDLYEALSIHDLQMPLWMPLALFAIPTLLMWRRDRHRSGHCQYCGYDSTGGTSSRCPECGTSAVTNIGRTGLSEAFGTTLMIGAVGLLALGWHGRMHPGSRQQFDFALSQNNRFMVLTTDGLLRIFWFEGMTEQPRVVDESASRVRLKIPDGLGPTLASREQFKSAGLLGSGLHWRRSVTPLGGQTPTGQRWSGIRVHLWQVALFLAAVPTLGLLRRVWRRRKLGTCVNCRYNLFGNTSGVCPECGTPIEDNTP